MDVYFQKEKKQIDADIEFFEKRIKLYEDFLKVDSKILWDKDINFLNLENYFHRKKDTIHRAIIKMIKENPEKIFTYNTEEELVVTKEGLEYLCKNYFKQKYLELLEEYKMELTEKYIEDGYVYDYFFGLN